MKPKRIGETVIVPGSDNKSVMLPNILVKLMKLYLYKLLLVEITLYIYTEVMSLDMLLSAILFYRMRELV